MGEVPRDEGYVTGYKRYRFPFDLHDAAVGIADANLQMVMEMEMLASDSGNLPAFPA
ncbi:hypothetical protein D3C86_2104170 [compost metagenome]